MQTHTFRLKPGADLFDSIDRFVKENTIEAGCILAGVGSLTHTRLRLADQDDFTTYHGHFEIVALTGTLSVHGSHLHIAVSDESGKTLGGHFESGCIVYTTAEIVLAVFEDLVYKRELLADDSGYEELVVYKE